jgi:hypothetical protein
MAPWLPVATLLAIAFAVAPACGGNKSEPAASPKTAPIERESTPARDHDGASGPLQREAQRVEARDALARAELELEASSSDCASACRALGSLERAASRLCDLADSPDDRRHCDDAKQKVIAARDRVRQTCSACPGGPRLDRSSSPSP